MVNSKARWILFFLSSATALLGRRSEALADTTAVSAPRDGDASARAADAHFARGKELVQRGKKAEARVEYLAAFEAKKSYDVAGNLGSLEVELGLYRDAAEHLSFAIRHYASTGTTPGQLEKARRRLQEARSHVAEVAVTVKVAGAEVLVDGVSAGRAPLEDSLFIAPGRCAIEAKLAGFATARQSVEARAGTSTAITLEPVAMAPPGRADPATPSPALRAAPKQAAGSDPRAATALLAGGALTAVGAGVGMTLTMLSNGASSDADLLRSALKRERGAHACSGASPPVGCASLADALSRRDSLGSGAAWTFAGAGVAALATVGAYFFFFTSVSKEHNNELITVAPVVAPEARGASISGVW